LNGLSGGAYTFESIDPEILPFQTGLTLRPAATETLVVKAMLDTRRLSVNSEPSGAGIWINGLQGSKTPGTFDVLAGDTVRLELRMPDYQTYVDTLILTSDTDLGIVALRKLYTLRIAPQYDYTGYLVYDEEGVMVFSGSGVRRLELPEGKYRVAYEIGEGQYRTKRVSLGYNQTVTIP
jgi:hypothetical protein